MGKSKWGNRVARPLLYDLGRCFFETRQRTSAGTAVFAGTDHRRELFGRDPCGNSAADAAGFLKGRGDAASADRTVHGDLGHLCDRADAGGSVYAVYLFWAGGAVADD